MALCNYSCNSVCGVNTSCVSQVPATELVIQPPAVTITIPGPVMSASTEPAAVAGITPCATTSCYEPGFGGWSGYGYGSRKWGSSSVCSYPYSRNAYRGYY